jgi:hypothetical protein
MILSLTLEMSRRLPDPAPPYVIGPYEQQQADHDHDDAEDGVPAVATHRRSVHRAGPLRYPDCTGQAQHDADNSSSPHVQLPSWRKQPKLSRWCSGTGECPRSIDRYTNDKVLMDWAARLRAATSIRAAQRLDTGTL